MTTHLTHTGPYAGQTFCGVSRDIEGDRYIHLPYAPMSPELRATICVDCLAVLTMDDDIIEEVTDG